MKFFLLGWYSDEKIIFRMIKWNLASKNDSKLWKFPIFDSSDSKCLTRYQKILWVSLFGCKSLSKFIYHTIKFQNCYHTSATCSEIKFLPYICLLPLHHGGLGANLYPHHDSLPITFALLSQKQIPPMKV